MYIQPSIRPLNNQALLKLRSISSHRHRRLLQRQTNLRIRRLTNLPRQTSRAMNSQGVAFLRKNRRRARTIRLLRRLQTRLHQPLSQTFHRPRTTEERHRKLSETRSDQQGRLLSILLTEHWQERTEAGATIVLIDVNGPPRIYLDGQDNRLSERDVCK